MKHLYVNAQMEIIRLDDEDIITTSGDTGGLTNGGIGEGDSGKFEDLFPGLK